MINKLTLEREGLAQDIFINIDNYKDEMLSFVYEHGSNIYLYSFATMDNIERMLENSGLNIVKKEKINLYSRESYDLCIDMFYENIVSESFYSGTMKCLCTINLN